VLGARSSELGESIGYWGLGTGLRYSAVRSPGVRSTGTATTGYRVPGSTGTLPSTGREYSVRYFSSVLLLHHLGILNGFTGGIMYSNGMMAEKYMNFIKDSNERILSIQSHVVSGCM
jgi:hypothetical protein